MSRDFEIYDKNLTDFFFQEIQEYYYLYRYFKIIFNHLNIKHANNNNHIYMVSLFEINK